MSYATTEATIVHPLEGSARDASPPVPVLHTGTHVQPAFVRSLAKSESNALGFLPDEALDWYAHRGMLIGGEVNGDPTCFALGKLGSPTYPDAVSLFMTAVRQDARRLHHAAWMLDVIKKAAYGRGLKRIQLWCRADVGASELWAWCGMQPVAARKGGSGRDIPHVCWMLPLDGGHVHAGLLSTRRRGRAGQPIPFAADVTADEVLRHCRVSPADLLRLTIGTDSRPTPAQLQPTLFDLSPADVSRFRG